MPADPVDLAEIEFLKDMLIADYAARTLRWHAVQAAGLGVIGVGVGGFLGRTLTIEGLGAMLVVGIGMIVVAIIALRRIDRDHLRDAAVIRERLRNLKGGG